MKTVHKNVQPPEQWVPGLSQG